MSLSTEQSNFIEYFDAQVIIETTYKIVWKRGEHILKIANQVGIVRLHSSWSITDVIDGNEKSNDHMITIQWSEYYRGDTDYDSIDVPRRLFVYGTDQELDKYFDEELQMRNKLQEEREKQQTLTKEKIIEGSERSELARLKAKYENSTVA